MEKFIIVIQVITLILIIVSVLLQQKGQGLSAVFGGSSGYYKTKRGAEKFLFWTTITSAFVFFLTTLWQLAS
ncbi:preprotein translocase subunit SecG [Patescibacteria group bacterium]|nr:preprotein translocase subunit SecG [Patescibacteria group bacterium]